MAKRGRSEVPAGDESQKRVKLGGESEPVFSNESCTAECSKGGSILSCDMFSSLDICEPLKKALEEMQLTNMTQIQTYAIPRLLEGKDVLGAAKTGSGKTLAFVIPAIDLMYRGKVTPKLGTVVLVLTPTRELALQIGEVVREAGKFVNHTFGAIMGGTKKRTETEKLAKGVNLVVATPGRLLDHMQTTKDFVYKNLQLLIMDEADRMLDVGFERELTTIVNYLPKKRQTALFSATQTSKVADLIRLSLKEPTLIEIKDQEATVEGLTQGYIVCNAHQRLSLLYKLLKKKVSKKEKVMVFFSSCASVQFHDDLFNYLDLKCIAIHGRKKQAARSSAYHSFSTAESGILLCTSIAARGLDFPSVDWIVQYDPPDDVREYIHRVGRTARGEGGKGSALLVLLPEEMGFLKCLKAANVNAIEYAAQLQDLDKIHEQIARLVAKNYHLAEGARNAYKGYMLAYNSHALKNVFDAKILDIAQVAKSFGMDIPPRVDLGHVPLKIGKKFMRRPPPQS